MGVIDLFDVRGRPEAPEACESLQGVPGNAGCLAHKSLRVFFRMSVHTLKPQLLGTWCTIKLE